MLPIQSSAAAPGGLLCVSDTDTIRSYFQKVRELAKSGVQYPVNLNEVWGLVYSRKGDAVRALINDFEKDFDYQPLRKNAKRTTGGQNEVSYVLSLPCMEFFIARKVRAVFNVYRDVFHWVADSLEDSVKGKIEALVRISNEQTEKIIGLESKLMRLNKAIKQHRSRSFQAIVDNRVKRDQQTERRDLFNLFEQYVKVESISSGASILDDILRAVSRHYNWDLRVTQRQGGEHYFDVAIRYGKGHVISEVIKSHLFASSKLK